MAETAMDRWYEAHKGNRDSPRVSVWYPSSLPSARLETVGHGCGQPDTLPTGTQHVYLTIAGVEFGGPLDEIELLMAAAAEALGYARDQYEAMKEAATLAAVSS